MKLRKSMLTLSTVLVVSSTALIGCSEKGENNNATNTPAATPVATAAPQSTSNGTAKTAYADGIYRGFYYDGGLEQISVQFELKDGKFSEITFRGLNYKDGDYLADTATDIQKQIADQYKQATDYLTGKDVSAIKDLMTPGNFVKDMDVVTGATLRSNKLASALEDGLNRGIYKVTDTTKLTAVENVADGTYRGYYMDGGIEQISIQFDVKDGKFGEFTFRGLNYKDGDYLADGANAVQKAIADQYKQATDYLTGKELSALNDLYTPEKMVKDVDAVTGATLRSNKLISAIHDGFNRGVYKLADTTKLEKNAKTYEDGIYRGFYNDGGIEQISIQFELKDGKFNEIVFRGLNYKDGDYLADGANAVQKAIADQYKQAADYLSGKDVSAIADLYTPEKMVKDADAVTGATLRSNKFVSALNDGLNRGIYKTAEAK